MTPDNHADKDGAVGKETADEKAGDVKENVDTVEKRLVTDVHHLKKLAWMQEKAVDLGKQRDNRIGYAPPDNDIVEKYAPNLHKHIKRCHKCE